MVILQGLVPYVITLFVLAGAAVALSLLALVVFFARNRAVRLRTGQPLLAYYGHLAASGH